MLFKYYFNSCFKFKGDNICIVPSYLWNEIYKRERFYYIDLQSSICKCKNNSTNANGKCSLSKS